MRSVASLAVTVVLAAGCSAAQLGPVDPTAEPTAESTGARASSPPPAASSPRPTASASATPTPSTRTATVRFDSRAALRDVRHLAEDIGPREATSRNFREAADFVDERLTDLGYRVRQVPVPVPAGNSWGVPVDRGRSRNVIATPPGFDAREPHLVVGAHLDTVAVSPGAEDNASGVAVLLELARLAAAQPQDLPVQFIAFGAEEPRGTGDDRHHFGSQQHVADLSRTQRRAVRGMVSLDRVGVDAGYVPVCRGGPNGSGLRADLRAAARRVDVETRSCVNQTSDHWSYEKVGIPAVRLGSVPYAGYHTRRDVVSVVDRGQLNRVGKVMWSWLQEPD